MRDMRVKLDKKTPIPHKEQTEEQTGDILQFLAVITSFQAVMFRYKIFLWISVFCVLSSVFNKRKSVNIAQYFLVIGMICLSAVNIYFVTPKQAVAEPN